MATKPAKRPRTARPRRHDALSVVEALFSRMHALDFDGALALIADDCVYQNVPFHKSVGKTRIRRDLALARKTMTGFEVQMLNAAVKGDVVLTERIDVLVVKGVRLALPLMGAFVVKNGKITEWRDYFDWSLVMGRAARGVFSALRPRLSRA